MKKSAPFEIALLTAWLFLLAISFGTTTLWGQTIDPENRPVADIQIHGLKQVPVQLVLNQIRLVKGEPYHARVVQEDIVRLTHLGRFSAVTTQVTPQDNGSVIVTYTVTEQAILSDVQTVGNKAMTDQELLALVLLKSGDPVDKFLIDKGIQEIKRAYEKKGFFVTEVSIDDKLLEDSGILIFKVREGPKVRIRQIKFEGNETFTDRLLQSKIKSETYMLILRSGNLGREKLEDDAALLRDYYHSQGYLDAQVGRRINLSPDQKDAIVVFFIHEGKLYTVSQINIRGNAVISDEQVLRGITLQVGGTYSADQLRKSQESVKDLYGQLGYIDAQVRIDRLFHQNSPLVDVQISIEEGKPSVVGKVSIQGNSITKDKVILRQLRGMDPGSRYDLSGVEKTKTRLNESSLFSDAKISILGQPGDAQRDAVVEIKEKNTGSLSFGAGISSDSGVIGAIDLVQRNFDIADWPDSLGELFTGQAFKGAGQYFALSLQPGTESSRYSASFREPYLLESRFFLSTDVYYWQREREKYDEERLGTTIDIGQRFGDVWSASVGTRLEQVQINSIEKSAPIDVFKEQGTNTISTLGLAITRNTTDSSLFPTQGSVFSLNLSQAGALGGDYDFTRVSSRYVKFWTVDENFLGYRTVLSARFEAGYIFSDAPTFERFYAGGHRSLRGFDYRGAGPRGIRNDTLTIGKDPVGGDWIFLSGLEYNFPIYRDIFRGVFFIDSGTVDDSVSFSKYRVAIGSGIRLKIPFLGQAPFALDFAIPLMKEPGDHTRLFSFDVAVPF